MWQVITLKLILKQNWSDLYLIRDRQELKEGGDQEIDQRGRQEKAATSVVAMR